MMLQKGNKFKKGKRKRSTFEEDKSNEFINCVKTYQKTLNNKILKQQQSYYSDGIKNLPGNGKKQWLKELMQSIKTIRQTQKFVLVPFFCLGEECQNRLLTISIYANPYIYLILPQHCPMSMVAINDTNKHYQLQIFKAQNTIKC
jgi:hypothetical protein